jgi:hypothetical protein
MICKALSPELNRGATRAAEIRDAFVRAHAQCVRGLNGRRTVLADFTVGRVANEAQLEIMKSHTIELLMQVIASSQLSFRQAGSWSFWNVIDSAPKASVRRWTARLW